MCTEVVLKIEQEFAAGGADYNRSADDASASFRSVKYADRRGTFFGGRRSAMILRHSNRLPKLTGTSSKILAFAWHELRDEECAVCNSLIRIKVESSPCPECGMTRH
jgi:hypothetical protein